MGKGVVIALIVISVLFVVAAGYIGYGFYSESRVTEQVAIYQQGAQVGYEQAVIQMYQQANSCQQVPLTVDNNTIGLVAVHCLVG